MPVLKKGVMDREIRAIVVEFCERLNAGDGLDDVEQQRRLSYVCRRTGWARSTGRPQMVVELNHRCQPARLVNLKRVEPPAATE